MSETVLDELIAGQEKPASEPASEPTSEPAPAQQPEPQPTAQPAPQPDERPKPEGWEPVDFSKLPPDVRAVVEPRFHRLYGQVKHSQTLTKQLIEDNRKLADKLEGLVSTQTKSAREAELTTVKAQIADATEKGEYQRAADLQVYAARLVSEQPKAEPKARSEVPQDDGLTYVINAWANEVDLSGSPVRPWAQVNHPDRTKVMAMAVHLLEENPSLAWSPMTILREIDRRMTPKPKPATAPVLGGDGNARTERKDETRLSDVQKNIAFNMWPELSKEKALEKYIAGLKETRRGE